MFIERKGDWVCIRCKNLNFSFRIICNRCKFSKGDSENFYEEYLLNLQNCAKINENYQNKVFQQISVRNSNFPQFNSNKFETVNFRPNSSSSFENKLVNNQYVINSSMKKVE